jgi:hypothetical protein
MLIFKLIAFGATLSRTLNKRTPLMPIGVRGVYCLNNSVKVPGKQIYHQTVT